MTRLRCLLLLALSLAAAPAGAASLYNESTYRPLTGDHKAYRPGDVLTVQISENSSATATADTGTRRHNDLSAELTHASRRSATGIGIGGDFDGGGRTQRTNRVLITLAVTVQDVLPNGDLRLSGEQLLVINKEEQRVRLEGRVRPQDVSDGNVVQSTRIADARITYLGEGEVSERGQRAWWRKLLDKVGL